MHRAGHFRSAAGNRWRVVRNRGDNNECCSTPHGFIGARRTQDDGVWQNFIGSRSGSPSCSLEQHALCPLSALCACFPPHSCFLCLLYLFFHSRCGLKRRERFTFHSRPLAPSRSICLRLPERERSNTNLSPLPSHPSRSTEEETRAVIVVTAELTTIQRLKASHRKRVCTKNQHSWCNLKQEQTRAAIARANST